MCREILSPIHEELAVSSGLDASDVWRCAGHRLYVQLPRTLSSTGGEHASKAICSSTRPPKWILWKPVESITDLITLLVMTRSKVTWIVRKIQIISLIRADTNWSRPPSWKFLNEGKLLRRRINNVATRFTSYLSTNQRFLRPVFPTWVRGWTVAAVLPLARIRRITIIGIHVEIQKKVSKWGKNPFTVLYDVACYLRQCVLWDKSFLLKSLSSETS